MSKYQVMPPLPEEHLAALRESIREHGIQVPVDVDESGTVLDGHNRSSIAAELGIDCPQRVVTGLSEDEKVDYAYRVNVTRRQLDGLWRKRRAKELRDQGVSQQTIAARLSVSQATVARYLKDEPASRTGRPRKKGTQDSSAEPAVTTSGHVTAPAGTREAPEQQLSGAQQALPPGPQPAGQPEGVRSCPHCTGWLDMTRLKAELDRRQARITELETAALDEAG